MYERTDGERVVGAGAGRRVQRMNVRCLTSGQFVCGTIPVVTTLMLQTRATN